MMIRGILLIAAAVFSIFCSLPDQKKPPLAVRGVLDLRHWDFEKDGPVTLKNEWEFYWKQLLKPGDFFSDIANSKNETRTPALLTHIQAPGRWNEHNINGRPIGAQGFATYRLKVILPHGSTDLALKISDQQSAYQLFWNGRSISSNGIVGPDEESFRPFFMPVTVAINAGEAGELIVQIANYQLRHGGMVKPIVIGKAAALFKERDRTRVIEGFLAGALLIMGFYHLALFFYRRKDRSALWFGLLCLTMAVRVVVTGERLLIEAFPEETWLLFLKLEYLSMYSLVPLFSLFMTSVYPSEFVVFGLRLILLYISPIIAAVLILPPILFSHTLLPFEIYALAVMLYVIIMLIYAIYHGQRGAPLILTGFLVVTAAAVNDMLYNQFLIGRGFLLPVSLFVFIFAQSGALANRIASIFHTVEELSVNLEKNVLERTRDLEAAKRATEKLNSITRNINSVANLTDVMSFVMVYLEKEFRFTDFWFLLKENNENTLNTFSYNSPGSSRESYDYFKNCRISLTENSLLCATCKTQKILYLPLEEKTKLSEIDKRIIETGKWTYFLHIPFVIHDATIGILCLHTKSNQISEDLLEKLQNFANQTAGAISNSKMFKEVQNARDEADAAKIIAEKQSQAAESLNRQLNRNLKLIQKDLSVAKKIQENTLSISSESLAVLQIVASYLPMAEVGGDFYNISKLNNHTYRVFLADATGHGVQAALMTMAIKGIYDNCKSWEMDAQSILEIINNDFLNKYISLNSFMTAILIDLDIKKSRLRYASAGHPAAVLFNNNEIHLLPRTGKIIGLMKNTGYQSSEMDFKPGDLLYIFTDGVFEEFNAENEEFGDERLHAILKRNMDMSMKENIENVLEELDQFLNGREKQDDITILGIEYK